MIETLVTLMLEWKTLPDTDQAKLARYRPLVTLAYRECKKYAKLTKVRPETCTALASNTAYWETGLNPAFQLTPLSGPGGEDCYFQIGRSAQAIPFPQWKLKYKHGTRHGPNVERCVVDGVRILSYHLWRCRITEKKLRGPDNLATIWKLYSEYYIPTPYCNLLRSIPGHPGLMMRRVHMAKRLLRKIT